MTNDLPLGHPYFGNLCGGFGAPVECDVVLENGRRCGKWPGEHDPDMVFWKEHLITERQLKESLDILYKKCRNCGNNIVLMCNQGEKYCSENCRKDLVIKDANVSS